MTPEAILPGAVIRVILPGKTGGVVDEKLD